MATKILEAKGLKPCPFCGSKAQMKQGKTLFVECSKPSCWAVLWGNHPYDISTMKRKWNSRNA